MAENNSPDTNDATDKGAGKKPDPGTASSAANHVHADDGQGRPGYAETAKPASRPAGRPNWSLRLLVLLLLFLAGGAVTLYFLPWLEQRLPVISQWTGHSPAATPDLSPSALWKRALTVRTRPLRRWKSGHEVLTWNCRIWPGRRGRTVGGTAEPDRKLESATRHAPPSEEKTEQDLSQAARIDMLLGRMSNLRPLSYP